MTSIATRMTASPAGESSPAVTVTTVPVNVSKGETIVMMSDGAVFNSLGETQDALRKKGGGIAMSDSGCTFTAMMPTERIGILDKTFVKSTVPVTIVPSLFQGQICTAAKWAGTVRTRTMCCSGLALTRTMALAMSACANQKQ